MADEQRRQPETPRLSGVNEGWSALSHLLSGVLLWGGVGWLLDAWLDTVAFFPIGLVLGAAAGIGLVWLRYSKQ